MIWLMVLAGAVIVVGSYAFGVLLAYASISASLWIEERFQHHGVQLRGRLSRDGGVR